MPSLVASTGAATAATASSSSCVGCHSTIIVFPSSFDADFLRAPSQPLESASPHVPLLPLRLPQCAVVFILLLSFSRCASSSLLAAPSLVRSQGFDYQDATLHFLCAICVRLLRCTNLLFVDLLALVCHCTFSFLAACSFECCAIGIRELFFVVFRQRNDSLR